MSSIDSKELDRVAELGGRTPNGVAVRIEDVGRRFGERHVLEGVHLDIQPGQFIGIVGKSGCGKSTLLRLLASLDQPSAGRILFDEGRAKPGDIRIMYQDSRLLPWQKVIDNVALGLPGKKAERHEVAAKALGQVGLADRANDWPAQLSGGQRQRVALARALVHRPRLLLLDEPLGALDALTRIEMQRLIEQLWREHGFTAVLVTHDVGEAVALADRVVLIEEGHIALDQPVELGRPRARGDAAYAALEGRVLDRLLTVKSLVQRNQVRGKVVAIRVGDVLSEVEVEVSAPGVPSHRVVSVLTTRNLRERPLEVGAEVLAAFKSNEVALALDGGH